MLWTRLSIYFCLGLSVDLPVAAAPPAQDLPALRQRFLQPASDARIMMRWWWFGPSVEKAELEREMRTMKQGGIGGFEVQPVYPLALDDPSREFRNLEFLSPEFLDALKFTSEKAKELGLRMDLTLGSGWPYGGPQVPVTQASGRLRVQKVKVMPGSTRVPVPDIGNGEQFIAAFAGQKELPPPASRELILPKDLAATEVLFFISSRTGMMVKRPAIKGEGFVLDHYDRFALDNYLKKVGEPLLSAFPSLKPAALFCDSLEVFGSDWTPDLLTEFQKRRGYDLKPHLPALVADSGPQTSGIRHDWGKTLTELVEERFLSPLRDWSKAHGAPLRIQNYGIPPATLGSHAFVDLPEGEGTDWKVVRAARWAASASHLYGKPVTSSETWTWLHSPSFRATPLDVKAEADIHFLQGINQLIGHGWPYNPPGVSYPGWRFYAAGVFNDRNPWWIAMPDVALYLQRVSDMLRQGQPANDVALYLPNSDAWAHFTAGRVHMIEALRERLGTEVMPQILNAGYGLDFIDERTLFALPRYRVLVLPGVETMPPGALPEIEKFQRTGGIVIATRRLPDKAPGLQAAAADHAKVARWSKDGVRFVEEDSRLGATLRDVLVPDLALQSIVPEIGFVHRKTVDSDLYFVANTGNAPRNLQATFRLKGRQPEIWDPVTGTTSPAVVLNRSGEAATIALDLEPYGSRIVVWSGRESNASSVRLVASGAPVDLNQGWTLTFPNRPARPLSQLTSWDANAETRFFSGAASYERAVEISQSQLTQGARIELSLGEPSAVTPTPRRNGMRAWLDSPVREAAVVYINDQRVGAVWCPPYKIDVTRALKPGSNRIRIVVGNTAMNDMAGHAQPDYKLLNLRYGVRFEPQDMDQVQPLPSGLLGPVRMIFSQPAGPAQQSGGFNSSEINRRGR